MIRREQLPTLGPSRCRRCQGQIVWAFTERAKRVCVDASPSSAGRWILWHDASDGQPELTSLAVYNAGRKSPYSGPLWSVHFATCPKRKRKSKDSNSSVDPRQLDLFGGNGGRR